MEAATDVFRALADPTRRALLDALFAADGQSVGALCALSPEMTRFGVMKHLGVLEEANLVTTAKSGRTKLHYLNPLPIALIAHRWISKYAAPFTEALVDLDDQLAHPHAPTTLGGAVMDLPRARLPDLHRRLAGAGVDSDHHSKWTRRYFHRRAFLVPPVAGHPYPEGVAGWPAGQSRA